MMRRVGALLVLLLRIVIPCFLVAPLALLAGGWMGGMRERPWEGIFAPEAIASVGAMLSVGALLIGLPAAAWTVRAVSGFGWRTLVLTLIGTMVPMILLIGYGALAAPFGTLTALACCLFNADRLREERPALLGKSAN